MSASQRCREFAERVVSDDPADVRWAREHTADCADCRDRLAAFAALDVEVERWRAATPEPSAGLERRILDLERGSGIPVTSSARRREAFRPRARRPTPRSLAPAGAVRRAAPWLAAAAGLLIAMGLLVRSEILFPPPAAPASALLVEQALHEAEVAEAAHARAIAQLEAAAAPVLARADDPAVPAREAALLLSYRERLRFLDRTVAEVDGFLAQNPNHAKARTVLLAAYVEKTEVLREVLALQSATGGRS